ncbi:MAG: beta-ketoacyl-[acyl-carrier-protein] synthase family protein [Phycisphaerales bacterium]|nr:beta-ketoacyl-[acyl-carrier-protein] synthase family protein [Phycisphaerales bacterium]
MPIGDAHGDQPAPKHRVVITGMGWVTPLGQGLDEAWDKLLSAKSAVGPVTRFDASTCSTNFAAEVKDFDLRDRLGDRAAAHADAGISTQFALAATRDAWDMAGMDDNPPDLARVGIYLGAGEGVLDYEPYMAANISGYDPDSRSLDNTAWAQIAYSGMRPEREVEQEPQLTSTHIAYEFGTMGPTLNCMTACAASTQAIGEAFEIIRRGDADAMIAGGCHSMIHPLGMTGFMRLTAMSTRRDDPQHASRPFDKSREGFVMGEGAGVLILESLESAQRRGANILCEVVGFGSTADAYRITDIHPDGKGGAGAMSAALEQAGIDPHATDDAGRPLVHYISAHGTGTQENDKTESAGVKSVFGELATQVPFSSIKSMMGHLIQAAGAVELMTCIQAIQTGVIPPTGNLHEVDPVCGLDHVPLEPRDENHRGGVDVCLSNSFGFGGQNDTICVRKYTGA